MRRESGFIKKGEEVNPLKETIHPKYQTAKVTCVCGNSFETGSTRKELKVEICSNCHPFYTGSQRQVEVGGRADRFRKKYGLN
ncbi:MAG TPA: 50S ribosomal protein L31 [Desulfotomaculum sp.]|nr:50S ribosomal protein L31 [Desulfotomaculum sp.]